MQHGAQMRGASTVIRRSSAAPDAGVRSIHGHLYIRTKALEPVWRRQLARHSNPAPRTVGRRLENRTLPNWLRCGRLMAVARPPYVRRLRNQDANATTATSSVSTFQFSHRTQIIQQQHQMGALKQSHRGRCAKLSVTSNPSDACGRPERPGFITA